MAAGIQVIPVSTAADLRRFIQFPYDLYKDEQHWVSQLRIDQRNILNPKKNAFLKHGQIQTFIAVDDQGQVVGRVGGVINGQHLKKYDDNTGFFGFFECRNDYSVAEALLDAASNWLIEKGMTSVRGPASPSLNDIAGLLVDGFDRPPSIMMPYNFSYYEGLLEQYGFSRAMTMWAYFIHYKYRKMDRLRRGAKIVERRNPNLKTRFFDMTRYREEGRLIMNLYNDAWSENWGHVPMTEAEFDQLADEMKMVVDPNLIIFLELEGVPIGFSLTLPDANQWLIKIRDGRLLPTGIFSLAYNKFFGQITECRTVMMGIKKEHQGKGFDALLNLAILESPRSMGYVASEMSWILDSNKPMLNAAIALGGVMDKEYALFEKQLVVSE